MFTLKIKSRKYPDRKLQQTIGPNSTLKELKLAIFKIIPIEPRDQKILIGFPPSKIENDCDDVLVSECGISNGEVIIVEEKTLEELRPPVDNGNNTAPVGNFVVEEVPSDNSCLFSSMHYLMSNGNKDYSGNSNLRSIVANVIRNDLDHFNEAVLEKPVEDYCDWIKKNATWGGAIELSAFSLHYSIEIAVLDVPRAIVNCFGEDRQYAERIFLAYDGIHYDPIRIETTDFGTLYSVPTVVVGFLEQAQELVKLLKKQGKYTDTSNFSLKCDQCGMLLEGGKQATAHAKETNHSAFREVNRNT